MKIDKEDIKTFVIMALSCICVIQIVVLIMFSRIMTDLRDVAWDAKNNEHYCIMDYNDLWQDFNDIYEDYICIKDGDCYD